MCGFASLTPDMQNRRMIDRALRSVGAEATPTLALNSLLVRAGPA